MIVEVSPKFVYRKYHLNPQGGKEEERERERKRERERERERE